MVDYIKYISCLTDNFADGQKIIGARLIYDRAIDNNWITAAAFRVKDRKITGISVDGCEVTLFMDILDEKAGIVPQPGGDKNELAGRKALQPGSLPSAFCRPRQVMVRQMSEVKALDGTIFPPFEEYMASSQADEPVICDFRQYVFEGIYYNLYVPAKYDGSQELPLVLFIHDAGACGSDPLITLAQGSGAISFASPEWQAEHPCFILAPQIDRSFRLTDEGFRASDKLFTIKEMLDNVVEQWHVDKKRLYATGQSMGCMAICELNILFPELFAASLLVAGQWSPERMVEKCIGCKIWILVSEHDARAFPGMNAVTKALEESGVRMGRYWWDGKKSPEELTENAHEAMKDDVTMRYTVFFGSSVVPPWGNDSPGGNHTSTWNKTYPIRGVREWLFSCVKE